ncbi:L-threonylcarbamoyladenylate synthase [Thiohalorhabdus sp.]|uniref:L-threonylcarbamoyladenylate synthase n=1 Tax=Thiohalorhabdus sp. TaxID=3094134 RepID=UPI002FC3A9D5
MGPAIPLRIPIDEAGDQLRQGAVLAYPTESCFGLGCDPANDEALERVLMAKERAEAKGLILIGGAWEHLRPYTGELSEAARARLAVLWPGPVTFLVPPSERVPARVQGAHPKVALRLTAHPHAARLCHAFGGALVSTSANREGCPAPRTAEEVAAELGNRIDGCVNGRVGMRVRPSAIVDAETGHRFR